MATEVKLPELGENIAAGDVIKVMVKVGDTISANQPVLEIETDKAAIEVPSPVGGVVEAVHVKVGQSAKVGQAILSLDGNGAKATAPKTAEKPASKTPTPAAAKTAAPSASPAPTAKPAQAAPVASGPLPVVPGLIAASPSMRRIARERGIDLSRIMGSGIDGRIGLNDLQGGRGGARPEVVLPDFAKWGEIDKQPMSKVRRLTAENLGNSWANVPQVTHYDKADITELEELRKRESKKTEASGAKITVTAILLKVVAAGLHKFPQFNASIDMRSGQVVYKKFFNVGVAVDTDRGLLVPVIRDVDRKNIMQLSADLTLMSEKARTKKIMPDEMQGGNFTISNLGGIGGVNFSPIVNSPEVAILGVSRSSVEPVYVNGAFVPRTILPLALSYDHRLIDGADAARFLRWVVEALQQPALLSFEG